VVNDQEEAWWEFLYWFQPFTRPPLPKVVRLTREGSKLERPSIVWQVASAPV
jgi:hypothetical protein